MVLLQREIPEEVNTRAASIASEAGVPVLLDCGGVEGTIASKLMHSITTLSPNETELARLTGRPSRHMHADGQTHASLLRTH
jgi:ribokinase